MTESILVLPDTHWRPIPGFRGYEVSRDGRIRSYHRSGPNPRGELGEEPRDLSPTPDGDGYLKLHLKHNDGKRYNKRVNVLVAEVFLPETKFEGALALHNDGDRKNNRVENLRWGTHAENTEDRVKHGTLGLTRTPEEVAEMKRLYEKGFYQREIARVYRTTQAYVHEVVTGKKRRDVK